MMKRLVALRRWEEREVDQGDGTDDGAGGGVSGEVAARPGETGDF